MEMPCRSAVYLSFLFLKAPPDRFYSLPLLPQGPDRPIPGTLQGTYRQVVLLKASSDDPVVSFRRQCGLTAQRFSHESERAAFSMFIFLRSISAQFPINAKAARFR